MIINKQTFFLEGENIALRALTQSDVIGEYINWLNDPKVIEFNSHGRFPMTTEKLKEYVIHSTTSNTMLVLAIIDKKSDKHIGNISLQGINWIDSNAEIAFLLGDTGFWGKGVMLEAGNLLITHAFKSLNLYRLHCGTSSDNLGMQKLALKLGMEQEGVRKQAIYKNGQYHDIIEFGIINSSK
jgi:RimJ/RimL family protein N-acetyltransferase